MIFFQSFLLKKEIYMKCYFLKQLALFVGIIACSMTAAYASQTGGMPYESVLSQLSTSLTGTVAKSIALIGIVGSGAALIFGGEISGFLKSVIYLVLVCSLLIMGNVIVDKFSSSGFEITSESVSFPETENPLQ